MTVVGRFFDPQFWRELLRDLLHAFFGRSSEAIPRHGDCMPPRDYRGVIGFGGLYDDPFAFGWGIKRR
jgi:hypothetical protein